MQTFKITIPGEPIPKLRHRLARGKMYDPQHQKKERISQFISLCFNIGLIFKPVEIEMFFGMPIPKKTTKKNIKAIACGLLKHTKNCDVDNLIKFYMDCMNGVVFKDDRQVFKIVAEKAYSEEPRTEIIIKWE